MDGPLLSGTEAFAFLAAALAVMEQAAAAGAAVDLISDAFRQTATPYGDGFPWVRGERGKGGERACSYPHFYIRVFSQLCLFTSVCL